MCFYNDGDYDWIARDVERRTETSDGSVNYVCDDCGHGVEKGDKCEVSEQYEHHVCDHCGFRHDEDWGNDTTPCEDDDGNVIDKDRSEEQRLVRCGCCKDFRAAIRDMEIKEGCKPHQAEPHDFIGEEFGNMGDGERVREYVLHAVSMFPTRKDELEERWGMYWRSE